MGSFVVFTVLALTGTLGAKEICTVKPGGLRDE
jgi:hypothetical protein